jgi:nuclear pore complex protein Nup133
MLVSARPTSLPGRSFSWYFDIDFFRDAYVGDVDASTGFALVATPQACFVWQHTQEIVPYGGSREPGLILAFQSGEVWFWNNIGVGLASGEQYSNLQFYWSCSLMMSSTP